MTTTTTADRIADLLDYGTNFEAEDGRSLEDLCDEANASVTKARTRYDYEQDREIVEEVSRAEQVYDRIRFTFADGSAIVVSGDAAWDIEGEEPFSWAGA